jgi:DNA topoisomerase I
MIVESPNKVKTLKEFLPSNYIVMASVGHVMMINDSGLYNMGIDPDNNFKTDFVVDP